MALSSLFSLALGVPGLLLSALGIFWMACIVIYRIYFHPLSHIPGPWMAAATGLYLFYFSVTSKRFFVQIEELHKLYGPVVRITPTEVHLGDSTNYDRIHHAATKYAKAAEFYDTFAMPRSLFGKINIDAHRIHRAVLGPLFSRKTVLALEGRVIQPKVRKLCQKLAKAMQTHPQHPVNLHYGFRALSADIITEYAFGRCYNLLDDDDFGFERFFRAIEALTPTFYVFWMWPTLRHISLSIPDWLVTRLTGPLETIVRYRKECRDQAIHVKASLKAGAHDEKSSSTRMTIFHQLLDAEAGERHVVPSVDDVRDEAMFIMGGTTDTTGNAMTLTAYHVISNEEIYRKLTAELKDHFPDPSADLPYVELEKLSYLTAAIKEGLRLSYGVIGRVPRVTPEPGAEFNGYKIPPGTIVGMSSWLMHRDERIFPSPDNFDPDRWLDPEAAKKLDRYLVTFSKGRRQCLGRELAHSEIYVTLGTMFRRFEEFKVHNFGPEDLVYEDHASGARQPAYARKFCLTRG